MSKNVYPSIHTDSLDYHLNLQLREVSSWKNSFQKTKEIEHF